MKLSVARHLALAFVLLSTGTDAMAGKGTITFAGTVTESTCAAHIASEQTGIENRRSEGSAVRGNIRFFMTACSAGVQGAFHQQILPFTPATQATPRPTQKHAGGSGLVQWLRYIVDYD